jgi:catechol 2,3-dioxygenase-like lactoylglutathione lyase family enzyme
MFPFEIETLDHVALRVSDLERAANWYQRILGLRKLKLKAWGAVPIFMVCENGSGVALFPLNSMLPASKVDHFAFKVTNTAFSDAQKHLQSENVAFEFQDHFYFHSIYFKDPDDHQVELTTQIKEF